MLGVSFQESLESVNLVIVQGQNIPNALRCRESFGKSLGLVRMSAVQCPVSTHVSETFLDS